MSKEKINRGFTLPELVIVMGVMAVLMTFASVNVLETQQRQSINSSLNLLISDIKQQQLSAMVGDSVPGPVASFSGVFFGSSDYTLFRSAAYSPADPTNFTVSLGNGLQFNNVMFPGSEIIFASGSGEIVSFDPSKNTLDLKSGTSNEKKTITLNKYGVVTGVN